MRSDDIYGPVVQHVNKTIRGLQRSSYVHLTEALQGTLKQGDLKASEASGAHQTEPETNDTDEAGDADGEDAEQWEELWAEGFSALTEEEDKS